MSDNQYWKFGLKEVVCIVSGLVLGAAFGFGFLFVKPAPPWWFLPVPSTSRSSHEPLLEIDKWEQYQIQGGYEAFCVQSTWGWAITAAILGLIFSNVVLRKKEW